MNRRTFCATLGTGLVGVFALPSLAKPEPSRSFRAKKIFPARWEDESNGIERLRCDFDAVVLMPAPLNGFEPFQTAIEKTGLTLFRPGLTTNLDLRRSAVPLKSTPETFESTETGMEDGFLLDNSAILLFDASRCTWNVFTRHDFGTPTPPDRLAVARCLDTLRRRC